MDPGDVGLGAVDAHAFGPEPGDCAGDLLALEADEIDALAVLVEEASARLRGIARLQQLDVPDPRRQDRVLEPELLRLAPMVDLQPEQLREPLRRLVQIPDHDRQLDHVSQHGGSSVRRDDVRPQLSTLSVGNKFPTRTFLALASDTGTAPQYPVVP